MGTSVLPYRYRINGLIDTSRTAIDNLELIGNSCATWITYDVQDGKWAIVINREGNSVYSFDDDNIIGAIKLNGTGLTDQYNGVEVRFPHRDLNDQEDFVRIEIPDVDRLPNEPDNILTMDLPVLNEPIQAQIVGLIELKQARLDKIITFQSDYSIINLQAGNIIDVTNSVYGWTNKEFRIIRMEETDVDGAIVIEITALEYDDNVYNLDDLYRYTRTTADGILTQGALGIPSTPSIVKFETDANPRVEISSDIPDNTDPLNQAGIIEGMEFWISTDGTNYTLLLTQLPTPPALTFTATTTVTIEYNNVNTNFYVKTRCSNSTTTSDFSSPASVIFDPVQVTDAIKEGTTGLLNSAGGSIATTLALTALLKALDTFMGGNTNAFNAVGKQNTVVLSVSNANCVSKLQAMSTGYTQAGGYDYANATNPANWISVSFTLTQSYSYLDIDIQSPLVEYDYDYKDQNDTIRTSTFVAQPALGLTLAKGATLSAVNEIAGSTVDWNANYTKIIMNNVTAGTYFVAAYIIPTYALNMYWPRSLASGSESTIWPYNFTALGAGTPQGFNVVVAATNYG